MDKILSNLGLCKKAGGVIAGANMVCEYLAKHKIFYIFLASDCAYNNKKIIHDKAKYYDVEVCESYSSLELSAAIGLNDRMVVGITNKNFLKILKK